MKSKLLILFLAISSIYLSAQCPRQTAVDNYHNQYLSANFTDAELNWTGNIINCTQGTMSATVLAKHLQKINYYRNLVGLESVILNDIKNQKALASVLMFEAENTPSPPVIQLTHCDGANNAPCNQYPCNSADGIEATKNSNLAFASPNWNNQGPIDVYMQDEGDSNQDVIHRRWILHSKAQDIGIASSTRFNAMYVIDGLNNPSVYNEFIAYPPSGYMPQPLVPSRWSFGIPAAIFSNATVTMQDPDGNTIPLTIISNNQNGFADNSIVWEPSGIINNSNMDVAYTITISNISNAAQSSYTYTTNIIPTSHPPFCPNEQVWSEINCQCEAAPPPCPTEPLMISTNGNTCALHPLEMWVNAEGGTYFWDYGDGDSNNGLFPTARTTHVYSEPGIYTIAAFIEHPNGCLDTAYQEVDILPTRIEFTYRIEGKTIFLQADTTYQRYVSNYRWNLGDGTMISGANAAIEHTYSKSNSYSIILEVSGDLCPARPVSEFIRIEQDCSQFTSSLTIEHEGCSKEVIVNPQGGIRPYFLSVLNRSFGGTNTGFIVREYGWHSVVVSDSDGCHIRDSIFIDSIFQNISYEIDSNYIQFDFSEQTPYRSITETNIPGDFDETNLKIPTPSAGTYQICFETFCTDQGENLPICVENIVIEMDTTQLDTNNCTDTPLRIVPIQDDRACIRHAISFLVESESVVRYKWDYGNGEIFEIVNPTPAKPPFGIFLPLEAGDNMVSLEVEYPNGCIESTSYEYEVFSIEPTITFEEQPDGLTYIFRASAANEEIIQQYLWSTFDLNFPQSGQEFIYTFPRSGNYSLSVDPISDVCPPILTSINVRVVETQPETDPALCSDGLDNDKDGLIDAADPSCACSSMDSLQAAFTYLVTNDSIYFTDNSTGTITDKQWTFNTPDPIIEDRLPLPPNDTYEICLIVRDECERESQTCQTIVLPCADRPLEINQLKDNLICKDGFAQLGATTNEVVRYQWEYPDGRTDGITNENPFRIQPAFLVPDSVGLYTIFLEAEYPNGCIERTSYQYEVVTNEVTIDIQESEDGLTYTFIASVPNEEVVNSYTWAINDPSFETQIGKEISHTFMETGSYSVTVSPSINVCLPKDHVFDIEVVETQAETSPELCADGLDNDKDGLIDEEDSSCDNLTTSCTTTPLRIRPIQNDQGCANFPVDLFLESENVVRAKWDYGNGQVFEIADPNPFPPPFGTFIPESGGFYTASLEVEYPGGCIEKTSYEFEIVSSIGTITYEEQPDGLTYIFKANVEGEEYIRDYFWSVLGESFSIPNNSEITLTFPSSGRFNVSLDIIPISNRCGSFLTFAEVNVVETQPETDAALCEDGIDNDKDGLIDEDDPDCDREPTSCSDIPFEIEQRFSRNVDGKHCITDAVELQTTRPVEDHYVYSWDYGNGERNNGSVLFPNDAPTGRTFFHYDSVGEYTIRSILDDGTGCLDTAYFDIEIISSHAEFSYEVLEDGLTIQLQADSTEYVNTFEWEVFGDSGNDFIFNNYNGASQTLTFPEEGELRVTLRTQGRCLSFSKTEFIPLIRTQQENSPELCVDGLDNDKDGLIDCEDSDCPCVNCPTDIVLSNQEDIDNYLTIFTGCREIAGNLTIQSDGSGTPISNVRGLSSIISIGGSFSILDNENLSNLQGIQNIKSIGGDFDIINNLNLNNLNQVFVNSIGGNFVIDLNILLDGTLFGNNFNQLTEIGGDLKIGPSNIKSLGSLDNLEIIPGDLSIELVSIPDLDGLKNIKKIDGNIFLSNNPSLEHLDGLINVQEINGSLVLHNNEALTSISGLAQIEYTSIDSLAIVNSPLLSICSIDNICAYINDNLPVHIENNAEGCATINEVATACGNNISVPLFTDYKWLNSLVNPNNCNGERVTEYSTSSGQIFVYVETNQGATLYVEDGRTWCTGAPNFVCTNFYRQDRILRSWSCGDLAPTDEDMDNVFSDADPDDTDPCIPNNQADACGNPPVAPHFLPDYPWLADVIDFDNCIGESITVYQTGAFKFFFVRKDPTLTFATLYNQEGQFYCTHTDTYDCIAAFNLTEIVETWNCGDQPPPVDEDQDGSFSDIDPDDANPCLPDSTATACADLITDPGTGNTGTGAPPSFLAEYSWLSDLLVFEDCSTDKITVYRSSGFIYLLVETPQSSILYNANGQTYCTNSPNYDCQAFYTIDEEIAVWNCGDEGAAPVDQDMDGSLSDIDPNDNDPCIPDNTVANCDNTIMAGSSPPDFLPDYPWLADLVNFETCTTDKITVYISSGFIYLFVETPQSTILYNANGQLYCTGSATYDCQAFYSVDEVVAIWECGTDEPIAIPVDGDGDGLTDDIDPDDMDACIPDSTSALCLLDSGTLPPFFESYPWLADVLNPFDCGNTTVTVYRSSGYVYLLVDGEGFPVLYNAAGLRYCANSSNYNCQDFYTVDELIETWNCENSLGSTPAQKRLTTPSNSSSNNMLQVFPNPTTGNFSIQLPKNLKAQSIQIISLAGQVVKSLEGGVLLYHLQLNEQEKGVYLVQVITGDSVITERIIVH